MLFKSQFFYFFLSFITTFIVGFFVWGIFTNPGSILNQVLGQVNQIGTNLFTASISPSAENIIPVAPEPILQGNTNQNLVVAPVEDLQDQLDDIQEKLDIIQEQVDELVAEQNQNNQVADADKDKNSDDKTDQDKKDDQKDNKDTNDLAKQTAETVVCTGQININTASAEDLDKITQVGPATAQKIIAARPFYSFNDLLKVSGIGPTTLQEIVQQGCAYVEQGLVSSGNGGGGGVSAPVTYPKIVISEVQIAGVGDEKQEFVELYNPSNTDVDLTGWYLQKKTSGGAVSYFGKKSLFSGQKIYKNSYFLIVRDGYFGNLADISVDDALSDNSSLTFYNPNDEVSDEVDWTQIAVGMSFGREWDTLNNTEGDFGLQNPTPKSQNIAYVAPSAPTLQGIAITTPATKLNYNVGDLEDITGLVVTGTYSDLSTQIELITMDDITGFDSTSPTTGQVLTVTFNGQATTYTVDINQLDNSTPPSDTTPPSITTYTISQPIISPNGDGVDDTTSINLAFSEDVKANVDIIDSGGVKIKDLYSSLKVKNPDAKVWDGTNNFGAVVADGVYTIEIVITNMAGDSTTDTSKTITIINGAPAVVPDTTVAQFKIISSPQTITTGNPSGVFTVESQNKSGQLANVSAATHVGLSSDSSTGIFFSASATTQICGSFLTENSITMSKGTAHKSFCYQNSTPGTFTITVSDPAGFLSSDFQSIIITTSPTN